MRSQSKKQIIAVSGDKGEMKFGSIFYSNQLYNCRKILMDGLVCSLNKASFKWSSPAVMQRNHLQSLLARKDFVQLLALDVKLIPEQ